MCLFRVPFDLLCLQGVGCCKYSMMHARDHDQMVTVAKQRLFCGGWRGQAYWYVTANEGLQ